MTRSQSSTRDLSVFRDGNTSIVPLSHLLSVVYSSLLYVIKSATFQNVSFPFVPSLQCHDPPVDKICRTSSFLSDSSTVNLNFGFSSLIFRYVHRPHFYRQCPFTLLFMLPELRSYRDHTSYLSFLRSYLFYSFQVSSVVLPMTRLI